MCFYQLRVLGFQFPFSDLPMYEASFGKDYLLVTPTRKKSGGDKSGLCAGHLPFEIIQSSKNFEIALLEF